MNVLLRCLGQRPHLEPWERAVFSSGVECGPGLGDHRDVYERQLATEAPGEPEKNGPFRRVADALLRYDIFPPSLVTAVLRRTPLQVGDAVGICYHFGMGIDLFFAARIMERFDARSGDQWRAGFTYRTLRGHPETGEETFSVEKDMTTGSITVALRSWSRPGILLAKLAKPITRRIQVRASYAALNHLQQQACSLASPSGLG